MRKRVLQLLSGSPKLPKRLFSQPWKRSSTIRGANFSFSFSLSRALFFFFFTINKSTWYSRFYSLYSAHSSYQETADRMSIVIRDRLVPPLEEAVYWIEYVARNRGAPWLRTSAHGMPFYQYLLLDVVGFLIIIFALLVLASKFFLTTLIKRFHTFISYYTNTEKKKTR